MKPRYVNSRRGHVLFTKATETLSTRPTCGPAVNSYGDDSHERINLDYRLGQLHNMILVEPEAKTEPPTARSLASLLGIARFRAFSVCACAREHSPAPWSQVTHTAPSRCFMEALPAAARTSTRSSPKAVHDDSVAAAQLSNPMGVRPETSEEGSDASSALLMGVLEPTLSSRTVLAGYLACGAHLLQDKRDQNDSCPNYSPCHAGFHHSAMTAVH